MTWLSLQTLENNAANVVVNPIDRSHGNAMHDFEQPSLLAILSSILNGIIALAMMKQPIQMIRRKNG